MYVYNIYVILARFTISTVDVAPMYFLCNYITKDQEHEALLDDMIKDFAVELVTCLELLYL